MPRHLHARGTAPQGCRALARTQSDSEERPGWPAPLSPLDVIGSNSVPFALTELLLRELPPKLAASRLIVQGETEAWRGKVA